MKKLIFVLSLVLILSLSTVVASAQSGVIITIDSDAVEFNDNVGYPFIDENKRTQVPFAATMEKYGATVEWDNDARIASAIKDDVTVQIPIGEKYIIKNGEKIETDTVALIYQNRTYLPIRPVIEAFGSEVEWDGALRTVVITTEPVDVGAILAKANEKSALWKNYDGKITLNMEIPFPDGTGAIQKVDAKMDMEMTVFNVPQKIKATSIMTQSLFGQEFTQPLMDMYVTVDEAALVLYMGIYDAEGKMNWVKSKIDGEFLQGLNNSDIDVNSELNASLIKEAKYFGKYTDASGRKLMRIQTVISGKAIETLLQASIDEIVASIDTQDSINADMFKNLSDFSFISYIDEKSGEMVKYEIDLGSFYSSLFANFEASDEMPQEAIDALKNIEAVMVMEIFNINKAKDFDIPEEALNAPEQVIE